MRTKSLFETLYRKLNKEQKNAVNSIEGPVMVVAGPGTGKTQILILRIAKILKETDIDAENILALTFTEAAANEMRERLVQIIGVEGYRVGIFTFHGFCNDIIQRNPDEFEDIIGAVPITESQQVESVKKILEDPIFSLLRPFGNPSYYVRPLLKRISDVKREGITPEQFDIIIKQQEKEFNKSVNGVKKTSKEETLHKQIRRNKELVLFYKKYQEMLSSSLMYDYDDMILHVVEALSKNEELLISLQEKYLYLLADEHQDVNHAQNRVLELLASFHAFPNLFIVGDEKQAIFRFQGASAENFNYFYEKYPKAKLIQLKENYRSTQTILDASGHIMNQKKGSLNSNISKVGNKIEVFEFSSPDVEIFALTEQIKALLNKGVNASDIAVLFRDNKDSSSLVGMFEKQGIPFVLEAQHDVLSDIDIKKLLTIFRAVNDFGSDELLFEVLSLDLWELDPLLILKEVRRARDKKITLTESIRSSPVKSIEDISKKLTKWHIMSKNQNGLEIFEYIVRESGFLSYILSKSNSYAQIEKLRGLHEEMRLVSSALNRSSLSDFLSHLNIMSENGVSLRKNIKTDSSKGVRLMTAHRAKGREFIYVFLINVYDSHWGGRKIKQTFLLHSNLSESVSLNQEERKLFYVSLTRAKKKIVILYSKVGLNGRSLLPSNFISEISEEFKHKGDGRIYEKEFIKNGDILFSKSIKKNPSYKEKEFISELFYSRGLSVSALNNYIRCPWEYFYINLIQIPRSQNRSQLYGIVVHNTLRDFFNKLSTGKKTSKIYLISRLKFNVSILFNGKDLKEVIVKAEESLSGYYDVYYKEFNRKVLNELSIRDVVYNGVRLTGILDKVELGDEINVVDYKTGRVRSRNEIEGKTKASSGDYKRQLVFYKLLLDNHKKGKYVMQTGELDFVESNIRGKYKKELFHITDSDVEELKKVIDKVISEIIGLKFYKKRCDNTKCEFCFLKYRSF